jgi:Ca2+-binding RTX toxin-like protein
VPDSRVASRLAYARIILVSVAAAAGAWVAFLALSGSAAGAGPTCFGKPATIVGNGNANTLRGTAGDDVIVGGAGRDRIDGRGGSDRICGGDDPDKVFGGPGADKLDGERAADDLFGEQGADFARGDRGADKLFGEKGVDGLDGGAGPDDVFGGAGPDNLFGGPNPGVADNLSGGPGTDTLDGEEGEDNLFGGPDDDDLDGGEDVDNCQQGTGTGPVVNCEADLAVDVVGPATASEGDITYTVNVTNNGPSSVGYSLVLAHDDHHLLCPPPSWEGTHSEPALDAGATRSESYTITCAKEGDPGRQVSVDATVSGPPDPTPGNDHDQTVTAVSE